MSKCIFHAQKSFFFSRVTIVISLKTENLWWLIAKDWNDTMVKVAMDIVGIW